MTPQEIEKRLADQHVVTVKMQENTSYPWVVTCSCNYQAVCRSEEEGNYYKNRHLDAHTSLLASNGVPQGHL